MPLSKVVKQEIIEKYGKNVKDTGNTSVQIALLTAWILQLTLHLKENKKDFVSKLSLFKMVSKRARFLKCLKRVNYSEYLNITEQLKLKRTH